MKSPLPVTAGKSLLGAALAGLSFVPTDADAAVYIESTDFGANTGASTDLSSTFGNFLSDHGIVGALNIAGGDSGDYIKVSVLPNTAAVVNYTASSTVAYPYFGLNVFNSAGSFINGNYLPLMPDAGTTYQGTLSFMTPADGIIIFGTSHESGSGTINYSIGAVPEPTSALLGAAGLAAAALRRRRSGN